MNEQLEPGVILKTLTEHFRCEPAWSAEQIQPAGIDHEQATCLLCQTRADLCGELPCGH